MSKLHDLKVHSVIGTLPGTTKTAVDLKAVLQCQLILLATTKIESNGDDLGNAMEKEVNKLAEHADEIWSVGPDLFSHFQLVFRKSEFSLHQKHKEILFKPDDQDCYRTPVGTKKIYSVWNHSHQLYFKGRKQKSKGSNKESFEILGNAVALINEENKMRRKPWLTWYALWLTDAENIGTFDVPQNSGLVALKTPEIN